MDTANSFWLSDWQIRPRESCCQARKIGQDQLDLAPSHCGRFHIILVVCILRTAIGQSREPRLIQVLLGRHESTFIKGLLGATGPLVHLDHKKFSGFLISPLECWRPRRDLNPCYRRERFTVN